MIDNTNKMPELTIQGKVWKRFPYDDQEMKCGDCGAAAGEYHFAGCDMERCPKCGRQLISCDCEEVCMMEGYYCAENDTIGNTD